VLYGVAPYKPFKLAVGKEKMNRSTTIRDAHPQDAERIAYVIRESFRDVAARFSLTPENCPKHPSNCTADWVESDLVRGVRYFILSQDGESIGCVGLERSNPDLCYLERLAVLPERRRRGLGSRLVLHALSQAKASGAGRISIGIIADHTELKEWYAKLGFVEGETKSFSHLPFRVSFMEFRVHDTDNKTLEEIP
jgi:N-acetylglutamate synthase-like GNAT family acetyltransferase